jgi:hypothetical protein
MLTCIMSDSVHAILLAENSSSGVRTSHIDTRYHFFQEHVEDGFIKNVCIKSEDNSPDNFTRNVGKEGYEKHVSKLLGEIEE